MLMPKRVKFRRVQRGRMKGKATRGNTVTYGKFGLQALEPAWITANQIPEFDFCPADKDILSLIRKSYP